MRVSPSSLQLTQAYVNITLIERVKGTKRDPEWAKRLLDVIQGKRFYNWSIGRPEKRDEHPKY